MFQNQSQRTGESPQFKTIPRDPSIKIIENEQTISDKCFPLAHSNKLLSEENITLLALKHILQDPRQQDIPSLKQLEKKESSHKLQSQESFIYSLCEPTHALQSESKRASNEQAIKVLIALNILQPISNQNKNSQTFGSKHRIENSLKEKENIFEEQQAKIIQSKQKIKFNSKPFLSLEEIIEAEESSFAESPQKKNIPKNNNTTKELSYEIYEPLNEPPLVYLFSDLLIQKPDYKKMPEIILEEDTIDAQDQKANFDSYSVLESRKSQILLKQIQPPQVSTVKKLPIQKYSQNEEDKVYGKQLLKRMQRVQKKQIKNKINLQRLKRIIEIN